MSSNFDGYPIDAYQGRFTGSFDIPDEYGEDMAYEDLVAFVVVGTLSNAGVKTVRGDTVRMNGFKVGFARPLTVDEGEIIRKEMGWETLYGEQLDMFPPEDGPKPVISPPKASPVTVSYMDEEEAYEEQEQAYQTMDSDHSKPIERKDQALNNFLYGGGH